MGKRTQKAAAPPAGLVLAKSESFDPTLASLFASSAGPVTLPSKRTRPAEVPTLPAKDDAAGETSSSASDTSQETGSSGSDDNIERRDGVAVDIAEPEPPAERPSKRRRVRDNNDDLEESYFQRLEQEEEKEQGHRQRQASENGQPRGQGQNDQTSSSSDDEGADDPSALDAFPVHETLDKKLTDKEKLGRTCFLGNVSTLAIKSKRARRTLVQHLRGAVKTPAHGPRPGKLESIRFRSTAYASGAGPKKATYAKKELMDETTVSTNAYAVFTTVATAQVVARKLNGSVVLDRHLRVDCLGNPQQIDHKRCVFIGNLSFVNDETSAPAGDDDQKPRSRGKEPADAEEGLWRIFGKVGQVESVRVIRDQETRVSKGFAYVQFVSENSVEAALHLNDKKFPPMLPRKLRVMRAKRVKTARPASAARLSGSTDKRGVRKPGGASPATRPGPARAAPKADFIFEGHRATKSSAGKGQGTQKRHRTKPTTRSSRRGAAFKAAGGKARK